ncbi:MAG TPA: Bax inhibitor-1 family protein [Actinomycetota bacterium]|nr:Bax inhibitor-1 family protein [Actinomycetota bacterium]
MPDALDLDEPGTRVAWTVAGRDRFLVRTYAHLIGAVLAFVLLEMAYFSSGAADAIARALLSVNWLLVLGAFIIVSWLARGLASQAESKAAQYAGLAGYVVAESIIFVPLLYVAEFYSPGAIRAAASLTVLGFVGLTAIAFRAGSDFRFLKGMLQWAGVLALVAIVGGVLFGFELGTWFSIALVGLAGGSILYDTSNVLLHYPDDRHAAASLELFASIALMFWYLVRLLTFSSRD